MDLGFRSPIVRGILDSLSCIPDSKAQDPRFHKPTYLGFRNADFLYMGRLFSWYRTQDQAGKKVEISCNLTWDISVLAIYVTVLRQTGKK